MFIRTLFYLKEYLFPSGCGGCGEALTSPEDAYYGLCTSCRSFCETTLVAENRCTICGKLLVTEKNICLSCRENQTSELRSPELRSAEIMSYNELFEKLNAIFPYSGKFKSILGAYKFKRFLGVGNYLTYCLNRSLEGFAVTGIKEAAWVPVPPRPGKIKKQGWDQIEFLARQLEKEYNHFQGESSQSICLPVSRCLKRLRSRSQKELNKQERGTNLKGRILCIRQPPEIAFIFDDVITTGATLNACAQALLEAGAKKVYGICLFYD